MSLFHPHREPLRQQGFTLVEILLYISITAILLLAVSAFLTVLLQTRVESEVRTEVDQQAQHLLQTMGLAIRNAEGISSPTPGVTGGSLTLDAYDAAADPTVFDLSSGKVRITEGAGSPVDLTSTRVSITSLTFENVTRTDTPGSIRITFTISYNSGSNRQEFNYSNTYYATYSLRQP
jgi:prepilin-type N-terminal cleavage/methylation domain-containing protein